MNRPVKDPYGRAASRVAFFNPQYSKWQLDFVVDRLDVSPMRVPSDERGTSGFYEWRQIELPEMGLELRSLATLWISSGRNFETVLRANPDLAISCREGRAMLSSTRDGAVQVAFIPQTSAGVGAARKGALYHFTNLMLNPLAEKLSGPCAHCDRFFVSDRHGERVYCSRPCSSAATSRRRHLERRAHDRAQKLGVAEKLIKESKRARAKDWKGFVANAGAGISKKWLTGAVNAGDLLEP